MSHKGSRQRQDKRQWFLKARFYIYMCIHMERGEQQSWGTVFSLFISTWQKLSVLESYVFIKLFSSLCKSGVRSIRQLLTERSLPSDPNTKGHQGFWNYDKLLWSMTVCAGSLIMERRYTPLSNLFRKYHWVWFINLDAVTFQVCQWAPREPLEPLKSLKRWNKWHRRASCAYQRAVQEGG